MARSAPGPSRQARVAGLLVALAAAAACANVGNPPGGPPDVAPPVIVAVRPESGAVVPTWDDAAEIKFDEVIDEMPSSAQSGGLGGLVLLSPTRRGVKVEWHRDRVTIEPRGGWTRGRVYRLELLPGILDLRRNRLDTGRVVLFSTGPAIGAARLSGLALNWVEQRAIARALVEAIPLPDSVGYVTVADSTGRFRLDGLAPGRYLVYASVDPNTNRRRDAREAYDSVEIVLDSAATLALFAFPHDTVGPRLRTATVVDSLHVRLEFVQALSGARRLDTAQVRAVELPDSTPVAVAAVLSQIEFDSLARQRRAAADTAVADSAAADTARADPAGARPRRDTVAVARDTTEVKRLLAQRPVPSDRLVLRFAAPLKPETRYLISVTGATNLNGASADGQAVAVTPKPVAPADTTRRPPQAPGARPKPPE